MITQGKTPLFTLWKREWAVVLVLIFLAALPRLCCLDLAEFKLDEAHHLRMAYALTRGDWRWTGSTASVGFPKPPLFVYTLALPSLLTRDPRIVTGFLGALAALSAGAFYLVLRRYLERDAAFGATLLFALNPQAVLYARKLFTADLIPPLCTFFLVAGLLFLESHQHVGRLAALVAFAFALLLLNTFSPVILGVALGVLFWERRRDLTRAHWLGAICAFALPFVPYLIAVAPRVPAALAGLQTGDAAHGRPPLIRWVWTLLSGAPWPSEVLSVPGLLAWILAALSLAGLVLLFDAARKGKGARWARFFLAWLCLVPLVTLIVPVEMKEHYLVVMYPLLFVLPAVTVDFAARRSRALGWGALALLMAVAAWQGVSWIRILQDVAEGVEGYGTPLGYGWRAVEQARQLAGQYDAVEIVLVMPGDQPWDEKSAVLSALLSGVPHRVVNGYTTLLYPPHRAVWLLASEVEGAASAGFPCTQDLVPNRVDSCISGKNFPCRDVQNNSGLSGLVPNRVDSCISSKNFPCRDVQNNSGLSGLGIPLSASPFGGTYRYRLWDPDAPEASVCVKSLTPTLAQWASGVQLLGYGVEGALQPGETLHVVLYWRTTHGPLDVDVHWFNHLLDAEGQRWGQFDGVGFPSERWQPGDWIYYHFDLPISVEADPAPYTLSVGQYTYPQMEGISVVDGAGNPVDAVVQLPLLEP